MLGHINELLLELFYEEMLVLDPMFHCNFILLMCGCLQGDNKTVAGKTFFLERFPKASKLDTYSHTYKLPQNNKTNKHFRFQIHILFFVYIEIKILIIFIRNSVAVRLNLIFKKVRDKQVSEQKKCYILCYKFSNHIVTLQVLKFTSNSLTENDLTYNFFPCRNSPYWARASSLSRLHYHTQTHHTRSDSTGRVIIQTQRPVPDNTHIYKERYIHAIGGIRTHNPSKRPGQAQTLHLAAAGFGERATCTKGKAIPLQAWTGPEGS